MTPLVVSHHTVTTTLGAGCNANWQALRQEKTGLAPCQFYDTQDLNTYVGQIPELDDIPITQSLSEYDCRNNRLALYGLEQDGFLEAAQSLVKKYGADRVAVYIGTSTSGIFQTELAYFASDNYQNLPDWYHYQTTQDIYSAADFVRLCVGAQGPSAAISTACSSSAKVFANAQRAITSGLCDAAIVGGVDTLCLTTLYGFHSLQLLSDDICRPTDANRSGISIGEAAGFALLEKTDAADGPILLSYGESSDAYHMSSPHPDGKGAYHAMQEALQHANKAPSDIDYINLHGTGTKANDLAESKAVDSIFTGKPPCSSTKGWTGHTLGAAGIVEAVFSLFSISENTAFANLNTQHIDPAININVITQTQNIKIQRALSNSFGFGGSNCSLLFASTL